MVTMAQRIEELRTEKGLSRPALSAALGFPKMAMEKFETGRQTPTREQQVKMAGFFGVSLLYLRGESRDRTSMESWVDAVPDEDDTPAPPPVRKAAPKSAPAESSVFGSFMNSKQFQDSLHTAILDVLRSPEGQALLTNLIRKELDGRK